MFILERSVLNISLGAIAEYPAALDLFCGMDDMKAARPSKR